MDWYKQIKLQVELSAVRLVGHSRVELSSAAWRVEHLGVNLYAARLAGRRGVELSAAWLVGRRGVDLQARVHMTNTITAADEYH